MNKVFMLPTPTQARQEDSNAINQIVLKLQHHLPAFGWEVVESQVGADLIAGHAGQTDGQTPVDVAHCHGLYPTAQFPEHKWHWAANDHVLRNIRQARQVTVPSEWVADILRRDMHINPHVIGWAIDHEDWEPGDNQGYVLWNKTRADGVCDPTPLLELAKRFPQQQFVTTFGEGGDNVRTIGRQIYAQMRNIVRSAGIYLATTRETFGIGTLEAMACGIPVLGFRWAGTADLIQHGTTGFLAEPGDMESLAQGLQYCLTYRAELGANAREAAQQYTWESVARRFADTYALAMGRPATKVSVVIPVYNYQQYLPDAIQSVLHQQTPFDIEIIVVNDCSTDDSLRVAHDLLDGKSNAQVVSTRENSGPAAARNLGIALAQGEYILCLDADDQLRAGAPVLQTFAAALDADRTLGIVYSGLLAIGADNAILQTPNQWPGRFDFEAQIRGHNQVPTCCMFRRSLWERAGGYRTRYEPAEDALLWLDITSLGYRAQKVNDEQWFVYRMHMQSLSNEVRMQRKPEPNWRAPHIGWIQNGHRPMAAPVAADNQYPTNPVRNYDQPLVSVIIPVGPGHEDYAREALDSLNAQTFWQWEAIVVFDFDYVMPPDEWKAYPWVRFFWTDGRTGAGHTRNVGAAQARGPFLAFLDADDLWHPEFLEATYAAFRASGRYIYTDWVSISKTGQVEQHECPPYDPALLFQQTSIHAVSVLLPKVDFDTVGGFAEDMGAWEDVELYMKLAAHGFCGERVARPLLTYRYKTGNLREYGETIKDKLKGYLQDKYGPYMRGEKMCACNEQVNRELVAPVMSEANPDVMRVKMDSERAPSGKILLKGNSGQQYGRRQRGDIFLIMRQDFEGLKHLVSPYQEYGIAQPAPVLPPPPTAIVREGAIV